MFGRRCSVTMLVATFAVLAGCEVPRVTGPGSPAAGAAQPRLAKTATYTPVSLIVTISDNGCTDANGNVIACNIRSDGGGAYTDGSQNVSATLDQYGNFIFDTQSSRNPPQRTVTYDLTQPLTTGAPSLFQDSVQKHHMASAKPQTDPGQWAAIQTLAVNASECVALATGLELDGTSYHLYFHRGPEDYLGSPTSYAIVTRTGSGTWTMQPAAGCSSPNVNVGALYSVANSGSVTLVGDYTLPFFLTLQQK